MEDFIHLHVHTYYSILDGQSKIKNLVSKAINDGMRGMAITDHGDMFGIKEFHDICNDVNKGRKKEGLEPFKPIFGCEMYVSRHGSKLLRRGKEDQSGYHLIVLAKNYQGYKNLIKLVSNSWVDGYYMRPRTDREDLERYHEDLIVCSACLAGEVPRKISRGDMAGAREAIEWYHRVFGDDYYLELMRHEVKDPTVRANRETFKEQEPVNQELIKLAREYGIKLICTNDVHFVDEENAEAHDHLLCLSTGKDLDDPTRMLYSKQEWFKTREEMNQIFSDVPEALSNTLEILDKVEIYSIDHDPIMPFFPIPESFGTEEEWRQKFSEADLYREFTTDENGVGSLEWPFNVAGAISCIDNGHTGDVFVKGKISDVLYTFSANYGTATFWISDDGQAYGVSNDHKSTTDPAHDFECYSVYWFGGQPWAEGNAQPEVGDDVIVRGQFTIYKGTYETSSKKAYVYSHNGATE